MTTLALPGTATPADILSGQTASSGAGFNFVGTMPAQGSPTLYPSNSIPAGNYTGGSVAAIKVASGTATSSGTASTFVEYGGAAAGGFYPVTIPVPSGANQIIGISMTVGLAVPEATVNPAAGTGTVYASPLGYADGAASTVLAVLMAADTYLSVIAGSPLSLTTSSIVLPTYSASTTCYYTVYYV